MPSSNRTLAEPSATLRARLRQETRPQHDRLDQATSGLNLAVREDFAAFLMAHQTAYKALLHAQPPGQEYLKSRLELIVGDLTALKAAANLHEIDGPTVDLHPLGLTYVIAGSQLGANALRMQWSQTTDPIVLTADRFLSDRRLNPIWKKTVSELKLMPSGGNIADHIVASASACFNVFATAFEMLQDLKRG